MLNSELPAEGLITERRAEKFRKAISYRQPDLTVVMENIHDPHNISAILRSCDAVGVGEVYVIDTKKPVKTHKLGKKSSASARKWVKVHFFENIKDCTSDLKEKGFSLWATKLTTESSSLYELDLAAPSAIVVGNEHDGVSDELYAECNGNFIIPMMGMIPSLNVSVACAVSLYEAFRQRNEKGLYDTQMLSVDVAEGIFDEWTMKTIRDR